MGEIVWGPEIPVNGVRPAWLADDVHVWRDLPCGPSERLAKYISDSWWSDGNGNTHIRLPADHFAYVALDKGFEPWAGGDAAPDDWDGGEVLLDDGRVKGPYGYSTVYGVTAAGWTRKHEDENTYTRRIIGYHKRATPAEQPADTVTIARMTEAEAQSNEALEVAFERHKLPNASWIAGWMAAHRAYGLIREETLTERFTRETGHPVTPAVEAALTWGRS